VVDGGDDDSNRGIDDPGNPAYWLRGLEEAAVPFGNFEAEPLESYAGLFQSVLNHYGHRCALTGLAAGAESAHPRLEVTPLRPRDAGGTLQASNFLCLSAEAHQAFEAGYLTIGPGYEIIVDLSRLDRELLTRLNADGRLALPSDPEPAPDPEGLAFHRMQVFMRAAAR
jgi:putative restriction endonuclease